MTRHTSQRHPQGCYGSMGVVHPGHFSPEVPTDDGACQIRSCTSSSSSRTVTHRFVLFATALVVVGASLMVMILTTRILATGKADNTITSTSRDSNAWDLSSASASMLFAMAGIGSKALDSFLPQQHLDQQEQHYSNTARFYDRQLVDHYSVRITGSTALTAPRTWSQRYYAKKKYFRGPGHPILLVIGGQEGNDRGMLYPFVESVLADAFGAYVLHPEVCRNTRPSKPPPQKFLKSNDFSHVLFDCVASILYFTAPLLWRFHSCEECFQRGAPRAAHSGTGHCRYAPACRALSAEARLLNQENFQ
jgi:Serine carboxypeptidase S28